MRARLIPVFFAVTLSLADVMLGAVWPPREWEKATPAEMGLDAAKLAQASDYALTAEGSGCIIYKGKLVMSWGDSAQRYDLKSTSKSIGVTLRGGPNCIGVQERDSVLEYGAPQRFSLGAATLY